MNYYEDVCVDERIILDWISEN